MPDSQIDVLQAEVTALKTLVLTSTPSSPNRQLHPQLQSPGTRGAYKHVGGHIRNKSASGAFPPSHGKPEPSSVSIQPAAKEDREVTRMKFIHLHLFSLKDVSATLDFACPCFHPSVLFPDTCIAYLETSSLCFFFSLSTNLCLTCSSSPSLVSLPAPQPAVPALLSLILCLVPGQSVSVAFDPYWQERGEGLGTDSRQVTASLRPGLISLTDLAAGRCISFL